MMSLGERALRRLKLSDLRLLSAVAQWGSMAKAAARLNISQPAVSKAIAAMEIALAVRLFDRKPRGLELTIYGQALLKCAVAVSDELDQGIKQIEHLTDPAAGELRIGSTEPLVAGVLATALDKLCLRYPRMRFRVIMADFNTLLYRELIERNVDLIVGRIHGAQEGTTQMKTLFHDQLFVTAGVDSPWTRRKRIALSDLIDQPWTLPPLDTPIGALMTKAFHASGLDVPRAAVTCFSIQMHNSMLATGRFLSMLSGSVIHFNGDRLGIKALPIKLNIRPQPVGIIALKHRTVSPVAQLFIDEMRDVTKAIEP
jgi:DNA-binding transcriptional LysR family regulator